MGAPTSHLTAARRETWPDQNEEARRWHGQSVFRQVEVEYSEGRIAQEMLRFVVVHASQLAQQQTQSYTAAQAKEAGAVAEHMRHVHARWFACAPMPKRPSPSMRTGGRATEAVGPTPGGIMPYTMVSLQTPVTRVVPGEDVQRRQTHHRPRQAIAWRSRSKP